MSLGSFKEEYLSSVYKGWIFNWKASKKDHSNNKKKCRMKSEFHNWSTFCAILLTPMRAHGISINSECYAKYLEISAVISLLISTWTPPLVRLSWKNYPKCLVFILLFTCHFLSCSLYLSLFTLLPFMHVQSCLITSFLNVFFLCVKYMSTVKRGGHYSSAYSSAKSPGEPLLLWLYITSVSPPSPFTCLLFAAFVNIFKLETHGLHLLNQRHNRCRLFVKVGCLSEII